MELDRQEYLEFYSVEEALKHTPPFDLVQLKYDGIWCRLEVEAHIDQFYGRWFSRTGELKNEAFVPLPSGTYLGEFMFGSHWAQEPERNGKTYLFDIVGDGGNDLTKLSYAQRYSELVRRCLPDKRTSIQPVGNVHISLAETFWNRVLLTRSEGLVFRHSQADYGDILGRLKRQIEVDYVILGLIEGKGRHIGRLGSLVCGVYIKGVLTQVCKVGGGLSDGDRDDIWNAWPRDRHRVITVSGRGQFPSGAVRHPNFERFRDDKRPEECTWTKPRE